MNLNEVKARTELGLYPQSDEYMKWLVAEVERLQAGKQLTAAEAWRLEDCQKNISQYKAGAKWYPSTLQQAEFLLELVERLIS